MIKKEKRSSRMIWLSGALIFSLFMLDSTPIFAKQSPLIQKRQRQLQDLHERLRQAKQKLRDANVRERDLSHQLHESQVNLHQATDKLNHYSVELRHSSLNLEFTKRKLRDAQEHFEIQKGLISKRLDEVYKNGKVPLLEVLFGANSYSSLLDRTYYLGMIVQEDLTLARAIKEQKDQIALQKTMLSREVSNLHKIQQKVKGEYRVYASLTTKREDLLGEVRHERQTYSHQVVELQEISAALERELQELIRREQAKGRRVPTGSIGSFFWPTGTRYITSSFGWRLHPIYGRRLFHTGVDIGAGRGAPIRAAADGVVIYAGWYGGYGQAVVIDHGGGLSTVYAPCSALYVRQRQSVRQGETIAAIGSTGNANGPHLHFEVRENGTAVDPMGKY